MDKISSNKKQELSKVIDSLRLPLIFFVVIAHLVPFSSPVIAWKMDSHHIYVLISELFSHHIAKISVRCYFLISGYYFFNRLAGSFQQFYLESIKKKLKTLLVPYLIWNSLLIAAIFLKNMLFLKIGKPAEEGYNGFFETSIYQLFWGMPINFPLWYIRDLVCMMLLSPCIFLLMRYTRWYGLLILGIAYLFVWELPITGVSTTALFFFSVGAYFAINRIDFLYLFDRIKVPSLVLSLVFLFAALSQNGKENHEYLVRLFIVFGVATTLHLFHELVKADRLPKWIYERSSLAFFIYVVHEIYIINWLKGAFYNSSLFGSGWGQLAGYFIIPFLCIIICSILFKLLLKIIPSIFTISLGGRLPK
ncbi:acyltransferase family protein [Sphingobacterium suaedae]|uniref:Acyltransferase family protein n=1 Tax=Sphingobacterium suaedae TaxID=1686402 RepID=A0ABW5KN00_9SPHI